MSEKLSIGWTLFVWSVIALFGFAISPILGWAVIVVPCLLFGSWIVSLLSS